MSILPKLTWHVLQPVLCWEELRALLSSLVIKTAKHRTYQEVKACTCHLLLPESDSWCGTLQTLLHFLSHHCSEQSSNTLRTLGAHTLLQRGSICHTGNALNAFGVKGHGMLPCFLRCVSQHQLPSAADTQSLCGVPISSPHWGTFTRLSAVPGISSTR